MVGQTARIEGTRLGLRCSLIARLREGLLRSAVAFIQRMSKACIGRAGLIADPPQLLAYLAFAVIPVERVADHLETHVLAAHSQQSFATAPQQRSHSSTRPQTYAEIDSKGWKYLYPHLRLARQG